MSGSIQYGQDYSPRPPSLHHQEPQCHQKAHEAIRAGDQAFLRPYAQGHGLEQGFLLAPRAILEAPQVGQSDGRRPLDPCSSVELQVRLKARFSGRAGKTIDFAALLRAVCEKQRTTLMPPSQGQEVLLVPPIVCGRLTPACSSRCPRPNQGTVRRYKRSRAGQDVGIQKGLAGPFFT